MSDGADTHATRIGYSQMQSLIEAYRAKGDSSDFPDAVQAVADELRDGDELALFHFLFGATLLASSLLGVAQDGRLKGKPESEILRQTGQVVNLMLDSEDAG